MSQFLPPHVESNGNKWLWLLEQQIEEYERVEQEKMKERHIANKKFLERMRQDESMQQFDG